jgi:class 3 adenylate cyclase
MISPVESSAKQKAQRFVINPKPTTLTMMAFDIRRSSSVLISSGKEFSKLFIKELFGIVYNALGKIKDTQRNEIELNKFMGDSMLVFFHNKDNAPRQAVETALNIRNSFTQYVKSEPNRGLEHLGMKFAVHKGEVLLGHFGCPAPEMNFKVSFDARKKNGFLGEYTAIGRELNRTFRMLQMAKKGQILIGENIWSEINMEFDTAVMDVIKLKDEFDSTQLFWVQGKKDENEGICTSCINRDICQKAFSSGEEQKNKNTKKVCVSEEECQYCQQLKKIEKCKTVASWQKGEDGYECCDWCIHYPYCMFNHFKAKNHQDTIQSTKVRLSFCDYYNKEV